MKQRSIQIHIGEYERVEELPQRDIGLVERAGEAAREAYAPYSGFHVGAAVLLSNGEVVTGNNQENASFPSGLCAERVAIYCAGSTFPGVPILKIAIVAMRDGSILDEPVAPCGGCRQVMVEKETRAGTPMEVILAGRKGIRVIERAADLLPLPFSPL